MGKCGQLMVQPPSFLLPTPHGAQTLTMSFSTIKIQSKGSGWKGTSLFFQPDVDGGLDLPENLVLALK